MFARISARILPALAALPLLGAAPAPAPRPASPDIAGACGARDGWSEPAPPAHIHGKSWYVGTCGITVVLVETSAGLVLIDTGPADAAEHVLANVLTLGFDPRRIKWILSTHEHFDHTGGLAAIQQATGARIAASVRAAPVLRSGQPAADDPQHDVLADHVMKPARVDRVLRDGAVVVLGDTRFAMHANPTHSPGSTSWTWKSCEAGKCVTIAYADSISTISSDAYRFTDHPQRIEEARAGLRVIERLPCDLLLTTHPSSSALLERLSGKAPLVAARACIAYAQGGSERFAARLAKEAAAK